MIIKSFEINKINQKNYNYFLFYGENNGAKLEIIDDFKKSYSQNVQKYEESEIIKNKENFLENVLNKSLFEQEKIIIVSRTTDKILDVIEEIIQKKVSEIKIILNAGILEKKSKLRSFFEKNKETVSVAYYPDNNQSLLRISQNFCKKNNINISQENLNIIINRSANDRINLKNELEKLKFFSLKNRKIDTETVLKLSNLAENYSVSELVDNCLSMNKPKTLKILNENNYSIQDCILIIRVFLNKTKRLSYLLNNFSTNNNVEQTISNFRPPIFWKEKDLVKIQMKKWSLKNTRKLIFEINQIETLVKKTSENSLRILTDFIINTVTKVNN